MNYGIAVAGALLGMGLILSAATPPSKTSDLAPSAQAALAPPGEPGERLRVGGIVFDSDGVTPARGVRLTVYQTDVRGYYSEGQSRERARISGQLTTGADGRFRFTTIRPGHYAGGGPPAHIHFELAAPDGRLDSTELQFADDPVIPRAEREAAIAKARTGDRFGMIQPIEKGKDGLWQATFHLKLPPRKGSRK